MLEYMDPQKRKLIIIGIAVSAIVGGFIGVSMVYVMVSDANIDSLDVMGAVYALIMDSGKIFDSTARTVSGGVLDTGSAISDTAGGISQGVEGVQNDLDTVAAIYESEQEQPVDSGISSEENPSGNQGGQDINSPSTTTSPPPNNNAEDTSIELDLANSHETATPSDDVMAELDRRRAEIEAQKAARNEVLIGQEAENNQGVIMVKPPTGDDSAEPIPTFTHRSFDESEHEFYNLASAKSATIKRIESTNTIFITGNPNEIYLQLAGISPLSVDDPRYPYTMELLRSKCPSGTTLVFEGSETSATVWCFGYGSQSVPPKISMNTLLKEWGYVN